MIPFLHKLILQDFRLKFFSLVLALLMWFTVNTALAPPGQRELNLPVVTMVDAKLVTESSRFRVNPKNVNVTLQGDPRTLKILRTQDIRVRVDVTALQSMHDFRCPVEVTLPAGVSYVRVEPEEVEVISEP
jgi:YbbR domain-containing protein